MCASWFLKLLNIIFLDAWRHSAPHEWSMCLFCDVQMNWNIFIPVLVVRGADFTEIKLYFVPIICFSTKLWTPVTLVSFSYAAKFLYSELRTFPVNFPEFQSGSVPVIGKKKHGSYLSGVNCINVLKTYPEWFPCDYWREIRGWCG